MGFCLLALPEVPLATNFDGNQVMALQRNLDCLWQVGKERRLSDAIHYVDTITTSVIMQWQLDIVVANNVGKDFISLHLFPRK